MGDMKKDKNITDMAWNEFPDQDNALSRLGYINGYKKALENVKNEIDEIISAITRIVTPNALGNDVECMVAAEVEALGLISDFINEYKD